MASLHERREDDESLRRRVLYDAFDSRIAKEVDTDGDLEIDWAEHFIDDGEDIALVFDGAGSLTTRFREQSRRALLTTISK